VVALRIFFRAWGNTTHFQNELKETLLIIIITTTTIIKG